MSKPSFQPWLDRWALTPDGDAFTTEYTGSWLLPVRQAGRAAILKLATVPEEIAGAALMEWWDGQGAAQVLARQDEALLLERAEGPRSLVQMSRGDQDDAATGIICEAVAVLHAPRSAPLPSLIPLDVWFAALGPGAANHGGVLIKAHETAQALLAEPRDVVALHGDVHHANILDFGPRGWLAIDPKGVLGERGYDYANPFCNPDTATALIPGRLDRYLALVAEKTGQDPHRLLMWILAYSGLSAAWILDDGDAAQFDSSIAELAAARLYG